MHDHPSLRTCCVVVGVLSVVLARQASPVQAGDEDASTNKAPVERVVGRWLEIVRDGERISVKHGDHLLLEYKYGGVPYKPYVSRLISPAGDNVLRDAPSDHLHHHGLMFAWRVNGVNFWEERAGSGREIHTQWRELRIATVEAGEDSDDAFSEQAILREKLRWEGPTGKTLVDEERVITVPYAAEGDPRVITWQSTFVVAEGGTDVVITGTSYNGLGARFPKTMDTGGHFQNEAGGVGVEGTNQKRATWCAYTANLAADKPVTIAMFDARGNPRHPTKWFTMDKPFAYLSGTQNIKLDPIHLRSGHPLTVRYGVGVFDGAADRETLNDSYTAWQQLPAEIRVGTDRGLIGRYYVGNAEGDPVAVRIDPTIAFDWSDGVPDDRLPAGRFTAIWEGELFVPIDGQFHFMADTDGAARIAVDDVAVYENGRAPLKPIELDSGFHSMHVEYTASVEHPRIRLCWQSGAFPRETISARYFVHQIEQEAPYEDQLRYERGRDMIARSGCAHCHAIRGVAATGKIGPPLNRVAKMGSDYLARWIRDPQQVRPGCRMPAQGLLINAAQSAGGTGDVSAIVAYLRSLSPDLETIQQSREAKRHRQTDASMLPSGSRNGGRKLFHELGCVACHAPEAPAEGESSNAPILADIGAKWSRSELIHFLEAPLLWHPNSRMGDFNLTEMEAADLAAYLVTFRTLGDGTTLPAVEAQQSRPLASKSQLERGKQLVAKYRCVACHQIDDVEPNGVSLVPLTGRAGSGCLSTRGATYQFALTTEDRMAVSEFLKRRPAVPSKVASMETAGRRLKKHFLCFHCHSRDGAGTGLLSKGLLRYRSEATVSAGTQQHDRPANQTAATTAAAPDLSGVGGKLKKSWLDKVLAGTASSPRPWLAMRMPRLAMDETERAALIRWLTITDSTAGSASPAIPPEMPNAIEDVAVSLMGSKGFSCAHCHTLGHHHPTTDTPAPDLAMVGQRISRSWFHRWLDNPARIRPGTPMPAFVRPAPGIAGDNLAVQKEVLWTYLTTTPPEKMVLAAEPERIVAVVGPRPRIVQGRIKSDLPLRVVRGVAIGLPNGNSLLFDGGRLAWLGSWRGGFLREVGGHGALHNWQVDGTQVWAAAEAGPPLVFRDKETGQWIAPPMWRDRFGWLDSVSYEGRGVRIEYRLRVPGERQADGEAGPWVHVTETVAANPPAAGRDGSTRRIRIHGVPERYDAIVRLPTPVKSEPRISGMTVDALPGTPTALVKKHPTLVTRQRDATLAFHISAGPMAQWITAPKTVIYPILQPFTDDPVEPGQTFQPKVLACQDRVAILSISAHDGRSHDITIQWSRHGVGATVDTGPPLLGEASDGGPASKEIAPIYAADPTRFSRLSDAKGVTVPSGYYVERLPLPDDFLACGIDFYRGKLLVGGYDGEIRFAEDTDGDGLQDRYRYFAGTMDQVNNLRIFDGKIFVATPGAVYLVKDRNGDEIADAFEVLSSSWDWSGHAYDWFFGLARDGNGNLYGSTSTPFERPPELRGHFQRGSVLRISPDHKTTVVGKGMRYNFGWTSRPDGRIYFTVNQGHWNITCAIHELVEGSHYGYGEPDLSKVKKPVIYVPYPWCRSLTGILFAESTPSFGPFQGDGFAADYNTRRVIRWTEQEVGTERQGACYAFLDGLDAGPTDMVFGPDGALYIAFMSDGSWYHERPRGGVYRVRYRGRAPFSVHAAKITRDGFSIDFTGPVDPASIGTATCRKVHRYFHEYKGRYHSEEIAHEDVPVRGIRLSEDARTLTLITDNAVTPRIYKIHLRGVRSADGRPLDNGECFVTVKNVP